MPTRKTFTLAAGIFFALIVGMGCSGDGPSSGTPFAPTSLTSPGTAGATISGTAMLAGGGSASAVQTADTPASLLVSVVGTNVGAVVDSSGRFTLEGVPAGDVRLGFHGDGVDATLTLPDVQAHQTVTIVVRLAGTNASVESETRTGTEDAGDGASEDDESEDDGTTDDSEDDESEDETEDDASGDDESADDESADDESADDESADDESADDESADDESADDESKDDKSNDDESEDDK